MPTVKTPTQTDSKKGKSPSNSRNNPEDSMSFFSTAGTFIQKERNVMLASFVVGVFVMVFLYVLIDIYVQEQILYSQNQKRAELLSDVSLWETIVSEHADYRDGYFQLALLYYQLGDIERSQVNLDQSLRIDPNFTKAQEFESLLRTK